MTGVGVEGRRQVRGPSRTPIVWPPLRGAPIAWVIILPRKCAKLHPCGTRTPNGHTWSGRTYSGVGRLTVKELGKLTL